MRLKAKNTRRKCEATGQKLTNIDAILLEYHNYSFDIYFWDFNSSILFSYKIGQCPYMDVKKIDCKIGNSSVK